MNFTELTTYQALAYHSRANRLTKSRIEKVLKEHNLTIMQWSVLGFIKDGGKQGVRISDLATEIDTSLAFITNSVNALEAKGIVYRTEHSTDNRAKLVHVTPAYNKKLEAIESEIRKQVVEWLTQQVSRQELEVTIKTLHSIAIANN